MNAHLSRPFPLKTIPKLRILAALTCLFLPQTGGCSGPSNPLIGSWKFSSATGTMAGSCQATNVFAEKLWRFTIQGENKQGSAAVTYNVTPKQVFVINAGTGGFAAYNIIDKNHVYTESAWGRCIYERTQ